MRYEDNVKPKEIGKLFHFRPERFHEFVDTYVIGLEERHEKRLVKAEKKAELTQRKVELIK